eukprot:g4462.t1
MSFVTTLSLLLALGTSAARVVTIHNDQPRLDVNGDYVDAHDGMILHHNGTFYLYGEAYGDQTLATRYPWAQWPRLKVYTSPDLVTWTLRGDPLPMVTGTLWIPNVQWHAPTSRFIMWFGNGGWSTATSADGIHFEPANLHLSSRVDPPHGRTDGTGVFVDDDGTGYVAFASDPPGFDSPTHPGWPGHTAHNFGHIVSVERLTPDLLNSTRENVTGWFPDDFVESPSLFKRAGWYYLTYGSCCCGCQEGGGQVVFKARAVGGPWVRQAHADINCRDASAPACGGYSRRDDKYSDLVHHAQWWGPSRIPLASGGEQIIFVGRRWLSGPNLPAGCFDICSNGKPLGDGNRSRCQDGGEKYLMRSDYSVWYPLEFDEASGDILPMKPMPSFTLELPDPPAGQQLP